MRKLKRPVKWTGDRGESLASDMHGRHQIADASMAFDASGRILGFRTNVAVDLGAYLASAAGTPVLNAVVSYPGTYDVQAVYAVAHAVFTNAAATGPIAARPSLKPAS